MWTRGLLSRALGWLHSPAPPWAAAVATRLSSWAGAVAQSMCAGLRGDTPVPKWTGKPGQGRSLRYQAQRQGYFLFLLSHWILLRWKNIRIARKVLRPRTSQWLLSQENSYCGCLSPCHFSASPGAQAWPPLPGEENTLKFEDRLLRHWHHLWPCLSSCKSCMSLSTGCRALLHVPAICPNLGYLSAWEQLGFFGDHRNWLCLA